MFCKISTAAKTFLDVVTSKIKHFTTFLRPWPSRGKSTALKHFCKCFIVKNFNSPSKIVNALLFKPNIFFCIFICVFVYLFIISFFRIYILKQGCPTSDCPTALHKAEARSAERASGMRRVNKVKSTRSEATCRLVHMKIR